MSTTLCEILASGKMFTNNKRNISDKNFVEHMEVYKFNF